MELFRASLPDFPRVRAFYDRVIDETPGMSEHARWRKGLHPSDEGIRNYLREGSLYLALENDRILGAMAVPPYQTEDYRPVPWEIPAADDEVSVVHLLAVDPAAQGRRIGRELVLEALSLARAQQKKALRLDAVSTNAPAQRLYTSLGLRYRGKQNLFAPNTGWTDFLYYEYPL